MDTVKTFELSNPQKRIWLTELLNDHVDMSNIGYLIELQGIYDVQRLARVIERVIQTHTALHLRFEYAAQDKSTLVQYFPDYEKIDVEIIEAASEQALFREIEARHRRRFSVGDKYHCAFAAFSIAGRRFGFFEKAHHLVADGISATVVAREIIELYGKPDGDDLGPKKESTYRDFVSDEAAFIGSEKYIKDREYWQQRFDGFDGQEITFALNKNKKNSLKVDRCSFQVPGPVIAHLEAYKADKRLANFHLFMAGLAIYFHRFWNHRDMVIGMPVHNRSKKVFKDMVGMFVSTLPFRIKFEENWTFNGLVAYIKRELWEDLKHQGYPYNHLVKDLKELDIDPAGFLNVQLIELPGTDQPGIEKRAFFSTQYNISQLSIYLNQQNRKDLQELDIAVDYHGDIFTGQEIAFLFQRLITIIEQAIKEPDRPLAELSLLEEAEYKELIYDLNDTAADFPQTMTLAGLFAAQVEKTPGNIALEYEGKNITYRELHDLTDKLAVKLQALDIRGDSLVGLVCERSIEAVLAILGVLKAGGAYLPIDPEYPLERKGYLIENSGLNVLLIEKGLLEHENELTGLYPGIPVLAVDYPALKEEKTTAPLREPGITCENLAYVIYTSGTTGNPKGTLLRHRNVINYAWWGAGVYVGGGEVTFPLFTSLCFDLTVTSIFIPLITGNKIVIYRESEEGLLVEKVVRDNKVDIIKLTPSHLKVVNELKLASSRIKSFILGGEDLKTETCRATTALFGRDVNIYNEYGPTETAVGCMIYRFDRDKDTGLSVPIGKPSANVQIYILDAQQRPLPLGIIGEIYIAGQGVARGYLHNEPLTAEKFVDNPFAPGRKMYKSGDLGRWNLDKVLEFFGRRDEQVKIRGFRIEMGEIENRLLKAAGIKNAVVTVRKGPHPELCAYLVAKGDNDLDVQTLRQHLLQELPNYMIPAEFVQVENIPLTRNGKVDFRKLEAIGKKLGSGQAYMAPRTEVETLLCDIWAGVLGADKVGITDNFYELGGDSIKAVQIAARLNDAGKTIAVKDIQSHQTIANISAHVDLDCHIRRYEQGIVSGGKGATPIEGWFLEKNFVNPHHFHQSVLLDVKIPVDTAILAGAFKILLAHHDGLRLNYHPEKRLFYFNNDLLDRPFVVDEVDLTGVPPAEQADRLAAAGYGHKSRFDIYDGPLVRVVLFKTGKAGDKVLIIIHHLAVDGISWRILLTDLFGLIGDLKAGKEPVLPTKSASLLDWYDALVMFRDAGKLEKEKTSWQEAATFDFHLPYERNLDGIDWRVKHRRTVSIGLDKDETGLLFKKETHEPYKTDVQVLVTAALVRTLRQWTGKQTVLVEMENHGRHIEDIDTSKTVGWFTALYPLLINRDDQSIGDEIKTVKEAIRRLPGQGIGYGIWRYMTDAGQSIPVKRPAVRFNYLGQFDREVENPLFSYSPQSTGPDIDLENDLTVVLEINALVLNGVFNVDILYHREVFSEESMSSLAEKYIRNLRAILEHTGKEHDIHHTPSDFPNANLDEDDLKALFE